MTKNTRDDVAATQRLQYDYRVFLQTGSTASLRISDAQTEQQAVGLAMGTSDQLGAYSFATNLNQVYQAQQVPMEKSQVLYKQLIPYRRECWYSLICLLLRITGKPGRAM